MFPPREANQHHDIDSSRFEASNMGIIGTVTQYSDSSADLHSSMDPAFIAQKENNQFCANKIVSQLRHQDDHLPRDKSSTRTILGDKTSRDPQFLVQNNSVSEAAAGMHHRPAEHQPPPTAATMGRDVAVDMPAASASIAFSASAAQTLDDDSNIFGFNKNALKQPLFASNSTASFPFPDRSPRSDSTTTQAQYIPPHEESAFAHIAKGRSAAAPSVNAARETVAARPRNSQMSGDIPSRFPRANDHMSSRDSAGLSHFLDNQGRRQSLDGAMHHNMRAVGPSERSGGGASNQAHVHSSNKHHTRHDRTDDRRNREYNPPPVSKIRGAEPRRESKPRRAPMSLDILMLQRAAHTASDSSTAFASFEDEGLDLGPAGLDGLTVPTHMLAQPKKPIREKKEVDTHRDNASSAPIGMPKPIASTTMRGAPARVQTGPDKQALGAQARGVGPGEFSQSRVGGVLGSVPIKNGMGIIVGSPPKTKTYDPNSDLVKRSVYAAHADSSFAPQAEFMQADFHNPAPSYEYFPREDLPQVPFTQAHHFTQRTNTIPPFARPGGAYHDISSLPLAPTPAFQRHHEQFYHANNNPQFEYHESRPDAAVDAFYPSAYGGSSNGAYNYARNDFPSAYAPSFDHDAAYGYTNPPVTESYPQEYHPGGSFYQHFDEPARNQYQHTANPPAREFIESNPAFMRSDHVPNDFGERFGPPQTYGAPLPPHGDEYYHQIPQQYHPTPPSFAPNFSAQRPGDVLAPERRQQPPFSLHRTPLHQSTFAQHPPPPPAYAREPIFNTFPPPMQPPMQPAMQPPARAQPAFHDQHNNVQLPPSASFTAPPLQDVFNPLDQSVPSSFLPPRTPAPAFAAQPDLSTYSSFSQFVPRPPSSIENSVPPPLEPSTLPPETPAFRIKERVDMAFDAQVKLEDTPQFKPSYESSDAERKSHSISSNDELSIFGAIYDLTGDSPPENNPYHRYDEESQAGFAHPMETPSLSLRNPTYGWESGSLPTEQPAKESSDHFTDARSPLAMQDTRLFSHTPHVDAAFTSTKRKRATPSPSHQRVGKAPKTNASSASGKKLPTTGIRTTTRIDSLPANSSVRTPPYLPTSEAPAVPIQTLPDAQAPLPDILMTLRHQPPSVGESAKQGSADPTPATRAPILDTTSTLKAKIDPKASEKTVLQTLSTVREPRRHDSDGGVTASDSISTSPGETVGRGVVRRHSTSDFSNYCRQPRVSPPRNQAPQKMAAASSQFLVDMFKTPILPDLATAILESDVLPLERSQVPVPRSAHVVHHEGRVKSVSVGGLHIELINEDDKASHTQGSHEKTPSRPLVSPLATQILSDSVRESTTQSTQWFDRTQ